MLDRSMLKQRMWAVFNLSQSDCILFFFLSRLSDLMRFVIEAITREDSFDIFLFDRDPYTALPVASGFVFVWSNVLPDLSF